MRFIPYIVILFFVCGLISSAHALKDENFVLRHFNFATIVKEANKACTATMGTDGKITATNASVQGTPTSGYMELKKSLVYNPMGETATFTAGSSTLSPATTCSITFGNLVFSPNGFSVNAKSTASSGDPVYVGATLNIPATCAPGTYTGSLQITASSNRLVTDRQKNINITFVLESTLAISEITPLNFGRVLPPTSSSGTVSLTPNGTRTPSTGVTLMVGGTHSSGELNILGQSNHNVRVSLPTSSTLTRQGGAETLSIQNFQQTNASGIYTLNASSGMTNFNVGGDLIIPKNARAGTYKGTYNVMVEYQ